MTSASEELQPPKLTRMGRILAWLCRHVWKVRDQVVLVQHLGKGFRCNPKYIALELLRRGTPARIVWIGHTKGGRDRLPRGIRCVRLHSLFAFKALAEARVIIDNMSLMRFFNKGFVKKPGQTYIQTWHGSMGFKRNTSTPEELRYEAWDHRMTDLMTSNSTMETTMVFRPDWPEPTKILEYGHPRVDILLAPDREAIAASFRQKLGLADGTHAFLYAPTFRDTGRGFIDGFDCRGTLDALHDRFGGEWVLLLRAHHKTKAALLPTLDAATRHSVIDVSDYDDIQELMVVADAMATDYSSCLLDFFVTGRPGFIYAPDLADYNRERGFYLPLSSYPFSIAETPTAFAANIRSFDENTYGERVRETLTRLGCVEDGHAAARVADLIEDLLKKGVQA